MKGSASGSLLRRLPLGNATVSVSRGQFGPIFLFFIVMFVISLFFVWSRTELVRLEYEISRMEKRLRELKQEERCMLLEATSLRNPQRIEQVALKDLGMIQPGLGQKIIVAK